MNGHNLSLQPVDSMDTIIDSLSPLRLTSPIQSLPTTESVPHHTELPSISSAVDPMFLQSALEALETQSQEASILRDLERSSYSSPSDSRLPSGAHTPAFDLRSETDTPAFSPSILSEASHDGPLGYFATPQTPLTRHNSRTGAPSRPPTPKNASYPQRLSLGERRTSSSSARGGAILSPLTLPSMTSPASDKSEGLAQPVPLRPKASIQSLNQGFQFTMQRLTDEDPLPVHFAAPQMQREVKRQATDPKLDHVLGLELNG